LLDLANERVLITAGATREAIDPVRFISNRSSGKMGFALADAARQRGATVSVVRGFTSVAPPAGVEVITVSSAQEMRTEVSREIERATVFIAAAAVADYRPKQQAANKIKKDAADLTLELERTPDILNEVGRRRRNGQLLIGFAAETENVTTNARRKLENKNLDLVVANDVTREGSGFDSDSNAVTILIRNNPTLVEVPLTTKLEVANRILDEVLKLRRITPVS
jgi:phosphopantothenoylcysteine decarboxylase/phosphopantothenate--cysteine ligase